MKVLIVYHDAKSGAARSLMFLKGKDGFRFGQLVKTRRMLSRNLVLIPVLLFKIVLSNTIILNGVAVFANPAMLFLFRFLRKKRVFLYWHEANFQFNETLRYYGIQESQVADIINGSKNLADSYFVAKWLRHKFELNDLPSILYECIDFGSARGAAQVLNPSGNKIVCVGNLCMRKGIDTFLKLAELVDSKWRFEWIGRNVEYDETRRNWVSFINNKFGSDRIFIRGYSDNPFYYINTANVFILPSQEEPFGIVCLEALALGKFVIVSPNSGFSELLAASESLGYVYDNLDDLVDFIDNRLQLVIGDSKDVEKRVSLAQKFDIAHFESNLREIVI